jgi:4-hydroxy-3-methylbut-2-enyl diphosphate reductase
MKKILLANPRGFCAGVKRAIETVEQALNKYGSPVYDKHEIVHNKIVVDDLKAKGAIFVEDVSEIPIGSVTIFSAHGVSKKVENDSNEKGLQVIDATCPLVKKVHFEAVKSEAAKKTIILIGHQGHPEVEGTAGQVKDKVILVQTKEDAENLLLPDGVSLSYITQTTLSVDDTKEIIEILKRKFPQITGPDLKDICYATQNRQNAVKEMVKSAEVILVVGSSNSSNSNRLRDIALQENKQAILINTKDEIDLQWLSQFEVIGVTAGASAPENLVQDLVNFISEAFPCEVIEILGPKENVVFKVPKEVSEFN